MPRRQSSNYNDDDGDDMQPVRRSQRVSTQRDNGHHLNYDQKSHPMDKELRPKLYRKRQLAHGIPVKAIEIHGSDSESESEVYDEDDASGACRGGSGSGRKRRRASSTVSRGRSGRPRGQRCSTLADINRIAKDYQSAWEKTVIDLTPLEAMEVQKSQYENAWVTLATQYNNAADEDDEDDNGAELGELPGFVFSTAAQTNYRAGHENAPQQMDLDGGINDAMFDITQQSQLVSSSHRSPASVAESLQDEFDGHGEDEVHMPPVVHAIQADRSFTPKATTPAARVLSRKVATPRKNKENSIIVHEDNAARRTEAWAQRNLMSQHAFHDDPKENNNDEEEEDEDLDGTTLIGSATVIHKSFEAPTLRQELQKRAPAKSATVADDVGDGDTVADEDEDEADDSGEDGSSDGDEDEHSDDERSPRKVKDEPVSSSAACRT